MRILAARFLTLALFGACVALVPYLQGRQKADHSHKMVVNGVGEAHIVFINVTVLNDGNSEVVMPSCGHLVDEYVVCFPPAFFEQYDGAAWRKVKDKGDHMYGEFAAPPLVNIQPGASIQVRASFPPDTYAWQSDQPVRLVIPIWPAADKTRTPQNSIRYVTPSLQAPNAGRLAFLPQENHPNSRP